MLGFIYSNQSIFLVLGLILILLMFYVVAKKLSTKVVKKNTTEKNNDGEKDISHAVAEPDKMENIEEQQPQGDVVRIEESEDVEANKKESKKPKIVQIYKRRERVDNETGVINQDNDPIYNRNVEFVNTSKNIAKFKSFADETLIINEGEEVLKDEFGFVAEEQADCEFCEDKVKHFDHSRRLSDVMKDDVNLFESHISEKYLNINSERHLNLNRIEAGLFERADKMLKNSEAKVKCECENHDECLCEHDDCCHDEDEDVVINMKTALISETYFNRKRKK